MYCKPINLRGDLHVSATFDKVTLAVQSQTGHQVSMPLTIAEVDNLVARLIHARAEANSYNEYCKGKILHVAV